MWLSKGYLAWWEWIVNWMFLIYYSLIVRFGKWMNDSQHNISNKDPIERYCDIFCAFKKRSCMVELETEKMRWLILENSKVSKLCIRLLLIEFKINHLHNYNDMSFEWLIFYFFLNYFLFYSVLLFFKTYMCSMSLCFKLNIIFSVLDLDLWLITFHDRKKCRIEMLNITNTFQFQNIYF